MMKKIASEIRKKILTMNSRAKASHSGTALSIVDILTVLYFKVLNIDVKNPTDPLRDKLLLSKGHGSSALYATLAQKCFFEESLLERFHIDDGALPGHLDKESAPGIEISSGSLGHGLSLGVGMALSNRIDDILSRVVVISGDGELNEGSMWEAIMLAGHHKLEYVTLIVDYNKLQGYGKTNEVINLEPLEDKFKAFGWDTVRINGHDLIEIETALLKKGTKPKAIIADTIKGKGVSYMENQFMWHYKSPNIKELELALKELS
jgi:transketolase